MTESQCAVFHFDVKTMSARDAEGRMASPPNDAPLMFASLAEAENYAKQKIAAIPGLGCRIYDRDGKTLGTFTDTHVYEQFHGLPAAKRNLIVGTVCLVVGAGLVSLDAWLGFRLIVGVLLGVRFLWTAAIRLMDGFAGLEKSGGES